MWDLPTIVTVELFQQVKVKTGALTMRGRVEARREVFVGAGGARERFDRKEDLIMTVENL